MNNKILLTADELDALAPYVRNLDAARSSYLRPDPALTRSAQAIYTAHAGQPFDLPRGGCGSCTLDLYRVIARWVDDTLAHNAARNAESRPSTHQAEPTPGKAVKPAKSRKK